MTSSMFEQILLQATETLKTRPNINEIHLEEGSVACITGDIHGNLAVVLQFFNLNKMPSARNRFIFNGDFVDRGQRSVEVLSIILAACVTYPDFVFLNRGNHEDTIMNLRYGFLRELSSKFPNEEDHLLELCCDVFKHMPVATIINRTIFICHGGIFPSTNLKQLKSLDRTKFSSVFSPSLDGPNAVNVYEWQQILNLLWNDTQDEDGCRPNTSRGAGSYFGPEVTEAFLHEHGFRLLIRSHECVQDGWAISHGGRVLTVFSSFDYQGHGSNDGAYIRLIATPATELARMSSSQNVVAIFRPIPENAHCMNGPISSVNITRKPVLSRLVKVSRRVLLLHIVKFRKMNVEDNRATIQTVRTHYNPVMLKLWRILLRSKAEILSACENADHHLIGYIGAEEMYAILTQITEMDLSWQSLCPYLVLPAEGFPNMLDYRSIYRSPSLFHPHLKGSPQLAVDIFMNQDLLRKFTRSLSNEDLQKANLLSLLSELMSLDQSNESETAMDLIGKLLTMLPTEAQSEFDFEDFLDSFQFVDIRHRVCDTGQQ